MGPRSLILIAALAACGGGATSTPPTAPSTKPRLRDKVVADFEAAVKQSKDAYLALFDFAAVGEYEILLHRYDLNGRLKNLTDAEREQFFAEDGTPYPAARERRNVGNFYKILAQRTVGTGDCKPVEPRTQYAKLLGTFEPLPARTEAFVVGALRTQTTPKGYYVLRDHAIKWLAKGGVVGIACYGGKGGITLVYTESSHPRGYDLITIYDD
jgi:hypothetical protein